MSLNNEVSLDIRIGVWLGREASLQCTPEYADITATACRIMEFGVRDAKMSGSTHGGRTLEDMCVTAETEIRLRNARDWPSDHARLLDALPQLADNLVSRYTTSDAKSQRLESHW